MFRIPTLEAVTRSVAIPIAYATMSEVPLVKGLELIDWDCKLFMH